MSLVLSRSVLPLWSIVLVGCSNFDALDACSREDCGAPDGGHTSGIEAGPCPGEVGPTMVNVGPFCIDSREVNQREYDQFLIAKRCDSVCDASGQPSVCSWNDTYAPRTTVSTGPDLPAVGIDWCDAVAYCAWAGKRLCGRIGGGSVARAARFLDDPAVDQWFYACSGNGKETYPYGSTYEPAACVANTDSPSPVGSRPTCAGGFPGLLDMSGNVWEWEDGCDDAGCANRGGGFSQSGTQVSCANDATNFARARDDAAGDTGFRCCSP